MLNTIPVSHQNHLLDTVQRLQRDPDAELFQEIPDIKEYLQRITNPMSLRQIYE